MPPIAVRLRDPSARPVVVSGYRLPDREGHYYLAIDPAKRPLTGAPPRLPERHRAVRQGGVRQRRPQSRRGRHEGPAGIMR